MGASMIADTLQGAPIEWFALSPLVILLGAAMVLLVVAALTPPWPRHLMSLFTALIGAASGLWCLLLWNRIDHEGVQGLVGNVLTLDHAAVYIWIAISIGVVGAALLSDDYLRREGLDGPELYVMYLLAAIGAMVMAAANDMVVLFLGLEILSIAMYVMAASHRKRLDSQESGLKYFVLGGFSSAFLLYGIALVYGATGSTRLDEIAAHFAAVIELDQRNDALALAGVAMLLVGLVFKVAGVPFHFWTPDVYQGAPTPVTAFMAAVGKAAAFAAMLRVLLVGLPAWADDYRPAIWVIAVLTLFGGSVMAVVQTDVKRMLAFSSVSHAGFILVGVEAAAHGAASGLAANGADSVLMYVMIYGVIVAGTFGVITAVSRTGDRATDLGAFRGLGRSHPVLALGMTALLLAQAGVPLTSGFVAKFGVINAAVEERSYALAVVAMVSAVIAAYLYLRIMISMWIAEPQAGDDAREAIRVPGLLASVVTVSVALTLFVGVFPGWLIDLTP